MTDNRGVGGFSVLAQSSTTRFRGMIMTSVSAGAVLSAAIQNSVYALSGTQLAIDQTQLRLTTGLRVNSALDNPTNFFEASALSSRAASLTTLLDNLSQSILTITAASDATTAINDLLNQADSVADEALAALADGEIEARINGNTDLDGVANLVAEVSGIDNGDKLVFRFIDNDGSVSAGTTVTIAAGNSITTLTSAINAIQDSGGDQVLEATLDSSGGLQIRDLNGNRFEVDFQTAGSAADSTLASALGFSALTIDELNNGVAVTRATVSAQPSLTSVRLFEENGGAGGTTATASTLLRDLTNASTGLTGDIVNGEANDRIKISVNGGTSQSVVDNILIAVLQDLVDGINDSTSLNTKIAASYDADTGKLNIRAIDDSVESIQLEIVEAGAAGGTAAKLDLQKFGFGARILTAADGGGQTSSESIELGAAAGTLASLEETFNDILEQIDTLSDDAEYSGTNLLAGDSLTTTLNAERTNSLVTEGQTFTFDSLGLGEANFGRSETVGGAIDDISTAQETVENYSSHLSSHLGILETRETFTSDSITNAEEGVSNLTAADQNEESARLLALQTRQLLGTSALALASVAQQSTLRLFG